MKVSKIVLGIGVAAVLAATTGCGPSGTAADTQTQQQSASGSQSTGTAGQVTITIKDFGYDTPATVTPGATITVKNEDAQAHTVTSDDGHSFDVIVKGGGTATFTAPAAAGTYAYHCTYHSNMHGSLVLK
jgi:plastocyanin